MFFSSVLVPSASVPAGRTRDVGVARSEPSSMFTSQTPSWRSVARSSCSHSRACAAERRSGSVTISTSGVPPRLKSTSSRLGAVDAPAGADVDELRRVLLEVHAVDAHVAQVAARAQGRRRTGRSGSPSGGRDRSSSCGGRSSAAASSQPSASPIISAVVDARALSTGSAPGRPRQTGQVCVLGGSPKDSWQPQNIFVRVASWTWISRPMTGFELGRAHARASAPSKPIACSSA